MLIGHQKQRNFLEKTAKSDKLAHAYLFCGQEKLGKKTIAVEFAKWLFKDYNPPTASSHSSLARAQRRVEKLEETSFFSRLAFGSTNECSSSRSEWAPDIIKRQHPDFIFIEPEKKEIQISQIRECIWRLSLKPSVAPFKIAIIDEAHCLNQEAQNSLLKTLEEPRGKTLIFLVTEYPERLFPTIISRCQILKFYSVPKEEIERYLVDELRSSSPFANARVVDELRSSSPFANARVIEVLYDDRKGKSAGEKFADADLIGIPIRIVISERTLKRDSVEIKERNKKETKLVKIARLSHFIRNW